MDKKRLTVALVGIALLALTARADKPPRRKLPRRARRPKQTQRRSYKDELNTFVGQLVKDLALTPAQQKPIRQIVDTYYKDIQQWNEQRDAALKANREAMRKAREAKDRKKVNELRASIAAVYREWEPLRDRMHGQIMALLTDQQRAKFVEIIGGDVALVAPPEAAKPAGPAVSLVTFRAALVTLGLTEAQTQHAERILTAAAGEAGKARSPGDKVTILQDAIEDIKDNVLTPRQRASLIEARRRGDPLAGLGLTDQQWAQVDRIRAAADAKARRADPATRRTIMRDSSNEIRQKVLTDAQRKLHDSRLSRSAEGAASQPAAK